MNKQSLHVVLYIKISYSHLKADTDPSNFSKTFPVGHSTRDLGSGSVGEWIRIQRPIWLHTASIRIRAACCSAWQCSRTVREIQSSSAVRVVCLPCGAHARPHWIRIVDPDPVNPFSVPVSRAPVLLYFVKQHELYWVTRSLIDRIVENLGEIELFNCIGQQSVVQSKSMK